MEIKNNNIFTHSQRIITLEYSEKLLSLGQTISLPANTTFIQPGDFLNCCYLIKSGLVVGCESYANGMVSEGLIMFPNNLVGESFLILNEPCPIAFKTIFDSVLVCIQRDTFMKAMETDVDLNKIIIESLAKKFVSGMEEVRQMASCNVTWRICNLLRIFAYHHGEERNGKICISVKLSQQIISQLLCVNRITTARIMKRLKDLHLIDQFNGYYWITDMQALIHYQDENNGSDPKK